MKKIKTKKNNSTKLNLTCSKCLTTPIIGIKYKCLTCPSYYLCEKCEKIYGQKHGHCLLMIRRDEDLEKYLISLSEQIPQSSPKYSIQYINQNPLYTTRNNNNSLTINLKVKNNGNCQWPSPCFFTCISENHEIKGKRVKLSKFSGLPNEIFDFQVKLDLSNINESGCYFSRWQMQTETGESFGDNIILNINDIFDKKLKLKKNNEKCNYQCLNKTLRFYTKNNNNSLSVDIKIKNNGNIDWPNPCFLTCIKEKSDILGDRIKLSKFSGKIGEIYNLKIKLNLQNIKKTGKYVSTWRIENEKGEIIGDELVLLILDSFEEKLKLKENNNVKDYRDDLEKLVQEIKQEYDIMFGTANIRNAIIRCQGNKKNTVRLLFTEKNRNSYYHK